MMISRKRCRSTAGFTMIELLVVLGIIVILGGITFGLVSGVSERGRAARAETELRLIAQSLEQFRTQYGDYPWVGTATTSNNEEALFNALAGITGPQGDPIRDESNSTRVGRVFIDFSRVTIGDENNEELDREEFNQLPNAGEPSPGVLQRRFLDPWGNPYRYYYRSANSPDTWRRSGFVLYSMGPEGSHSPPSNNGDISETSANMDNIYHDN
jgi:prepilin-type N-terminal cleavage/methylation domain-containing protein